MENLSAKTEVRLSVTKEKKFIDSSIPSPNYRLLESFACVAGVSKRQKSTRLKRNCERVRIGKEMVTTQATGSYSFLLGSNRVFIRKRERGGYAGLWMDESVATMSCPNLLSGNGVISGVM